MSVQVIRFAPGLKPVLKHEGGGHDQSSHGNWADGSHDASVISTDTQIAFHDGAIKATDNILSPSAYKSQLTGNLNRTYPKTYLDEAVNNPVYQEALQGHLKRVGFPETVRVFSSSTQEGEYFHGSVAPLWDSGAVGYESKESPKEFSVNRSDIIGIGKVADSGIWFRNSKEVKKHGTHDQKTHGSWAEGSSESGLDAMPYEWKPEFKERERLTSSELSFEELNLGREQLKQIADSPITVRVSSGDLELRKIAEEGRFKSLTEMPEPKLGYEIDYREGRFDLEKGLWGLPTDSHSPIYGYFDTPLQSWVDNQTSHYGDVKIVLKDSVVGRTTISAGDSANHGLTPVLVTDARKGNLSLEQVDSAYRSRHFQRGATSVGMPVRSVRTVGEIDYFEAQIHGGVRLSDIKSVRLEKYSIVGDSTIALLEKAGIEVTRDDK